MAERGRTTMTSRTASLLVEMTLHVAYAKSSLRRGALGCCSQSPPGSLLKIRKKAKANGVLFKRKDA